MTTPRHCGIVLIVGKERVKKASIERLEVGSIASERFELSAKCPNNHCAAATTYVQPRKGL